MRESLFLKIPLAANQRRCGRVVGYLGFSRILQRYVASPIINLNAIQNGSAKIMAEPSFTCSSLCLFSRFRTLIFACLIMENSAGNNQKASGSGACSTPQHHDSDRATIPSRNLQEVMLLTAVLSRGWWCSVLGALPFAVLAG